jgi:hypothetical protein
MKIQINNNEKYKSTMKIQIINEIILDSNIIFNYHHNEN